MKNTFFGRTSAGVHVNKPSSKTCYCFLIMLLLFFFSLAGQRRQARAPFPTSENGRANWINAISTLPIFHGFKVRYACGFSVLLDCIRKECSTPQESARKCVLFLFSIFFSSFFFAQCQFTDEVCSRNSFHFISMALKEWLKWREKMKGN